MTTMGAMCLNCKIIEREKSQFVDLLMIFQSADVLINLGAMVPSTLGQPPETTITITLFGGDLMKIIASTSTTWQWQC